MTKINMRAGVPRTFGDDFTREQVERELEALRARMTTPFAVTLGITLAVRGGRLLRDGDPVEVTDLVDERDHTGRIVVTAAERFDDLLRRGVIIEKL